jgi:hypothetical protein
MALQRITFWATRIFAHDQTIRKKRRALPSTKGAFNFKAGRREDLGKMGKGDILYFLFEFLKESHALDGDFEAVNIMLLRHNLDG